MGSLKRLHEIQQAALSEPLQQQHTQSAQPAGHLFLRFVGPSQLLPRLGAQAYLPSHLSEAIIVININITITTDTLRPSPRREGDSFLPPCPRA